MKKALVILLLLTPLLLEAKLQGRARIDSLLKELPRAKEDTNKVKLLNTLSFGLCFIDPDDGMKYGAQGLKLAEYLKWKKGVAGAYNSLSNNYYQKSDYNTAIEIGMKALEINETIADKSAIATNLENIANNYDAQGNFTKSLEYNLKSLKIAEEINDVKLTATNLMNIGNTYTEFSDYTKALEYLLMALKKEEERGDKQHMAHCMANIGSVYYLQKNNALALEYDLSALRLSEELGDKDGMLVAEEDAANVYQAEGSYALALEFVFKSLKTSAETENKEATASELGEIGATYLMIAKDSTHTIRGEHIPINKKACVDSAVRYLNKSVVIGKEINSLNLLIDVYKNLATAYRLMGKYSDALSSYESYMAIKDSVFSTDNKVKIANLETKREESLKEKQIELNKLSETKKRNEQVLFILAVGLLSIVIIVVMRNYSAQKKANKIKEGLLRQKDLLMKEIHHRVKNNLQVISTLLDSELTNISDEHAKDAMTESTTRVRSISLIHQQLYQNESITTIEFSRFAIDLSHQIRSVFNKKYQDILLKNNIPETMLDIDTAVPLGLILNELMTNSYKYAFADTAGGSIEITLLQTGSNYQLTYTDSGPGLPKNLDVSSLKSIGMQMIRNLSKQIGGKSMYVEADKTFIITFKDEAGRQLID